MFKNIFVSKNEETFFFSRKQRRAYRAKFHFILVHSIQTWTEASRAGGGAGRDRTDDILLAKQALSQLSYSP
jgi:hypothetical protein